ncbi:MAG: glycosyltransferase family 4 protein [Candidatus Omnitrophota bacterium]
MKNIKKRAFNFVMIFFAAGQRVKKLLRRDKGFKLGFLVEEFFHKDLRGFGGYGMTIKNLTDYFNAAGRSPKADVLMSSQFAHHRFGIKRYHNADVLFREGHTRKYVINFFKYSRMVNQRNIDLIITIGWYRSYEYCAYALSATPIVVWIHDPRGKEEWDKIMTVPLELKVIGDDYKSGDLSKVVNGKINSFQNFLQQSRKSNRKIFFATTTPCLIERARRSYGLDNIEAFVLPICIDLPDIQKPAYSEKPSLLFLARLEPYKRPWIYFELAKRFPQVDFLVAGIAHFPEVVNPILEKYQNIPNLKFLGLIEGAEKHKALNSVWALVNTSIHEGQPVSFLEAFSYYKPVISCHDPDEIVSKYGWFTGQSIGEGLDDQTLDSFSLAIRECLNNSKVREEKGFQARKYVEEHNTYAKFGEIVQKFVLGELTK